MTIFFSYINYRTTGFQVTRAFQNASLLNQMKKIINSTTDFLGLQETLLSSPPSPTVNPKENNDIPAGCSARHMHTGWGAELPTAAKRELLYYPKIQGTS